VNLSRGTKIGLAVVMVLTLIGGVTVLLRPGGPVNRTNVVAYFENSNGIFVGDDVVILGVAVGQIDKIEPEPQRVKISFWYDSK
jgi:phospholipid/cholesterol/gamma-HCH transport system substrate-binding protein